MAALIERPSVSGARVLVTGATGFLGSHLVCALARAGADVHATRASASRAPAIPLPFVVWHDADITDECRLQEVMGLAAPDIVMHLAAYGARSAQREARSILDVNVIGTWNILRAVPARARFVMTGTCAEYGQIQGAAHEQMACRPAAMYPAAKHAAVTLATAYARETGLSVVVLRPYGPFGPGDDPNRVIPAAIQGLMKGEHVRLTDGRQLRDFSYVDDHVDALLRAAAIPALQPGAIYNVGTGRAVTVRAALERIAAIVGGPGRLEFGARPYREDDLRELVPDVSAAHRDLGFEARVPFDEGIRRTAAWMQDAGAVRESQP